MTAWTGVWSRLPEQANHPSTHAEIHFKRDLVEAARFLKGKPGLQRLLAAQVMHGFLFSFEVALLAPLTFLVFSMQTAGLVQIVSADSTSSTALIVYACSEITAGDSVEKYVPQPAFYAVSPGTPRYEDPARIIFGEYGRSAAAKGEMMVMDHGIMQGVQRGQRVTVFRRPRPDAPPVPVGDGVVIAH